MINIFKKYAKKDLSMPNKEKKTLTIQKLLAKRLLHFVLSKYYSIDRVRLKYNEYGKPLLSDKSLLQFNISHSKDTIIIAINNMGVEIGVDVQWPKAIKYSDSFVNHKERELLMDLRLNDLWAIKESYVKMSGIGINKSLLSFSIIKDISGKFMIIEGERLMAYSQLFRDSEYSFAICAPVRIDLSKIYVNYLCVSNESKYDKEM